MVAQQRDVWLVTGCTSGFGEELIRQIIQRGDIAIGAGRNATKRCQNLAKLGASFIDLDLAWNNEKIEETVKKAISIHGRIDHLINNAGYGATDIFEEMPNERLVESFNVNFFGTVSVTRAVFPSMRQRGAGKIAIVGSLAGWQGCFGMSAYCAVKYALEGFAESFAHESAMFGVQTLIFEPGAVNTGIASKFPPSRGNRLAIYDKLHKHGDEYLANMVPPGEMTKAVARMVEVMTGTGMAMGRDTPLRLPLGSDCLFSVRKKCKETLELCDQWEDVISSVDRDDIDEKMQVANAFGVAQ